MTDCLGMSDDANVSQVLRYVVIQEECQSRTECLPRVNKATGFLGDAKLSNS